MALINVNNVEVLDNPAPSTNPFQFEVYFECLQELDAGSFLICLLSLLQELVPFGFKT